MQTLFVLAQTGSPSFAERVEDFFTGRQFIVSVVILGVAVASYFVITRVGHAAFIRIGSRPGRAEDPVAAAERAQRMETLWTVVRKVLLITLAVVTALTLLSFWRVPIASLLAVGTVVGVALGFGAQSLVKDVISGFFIVSEHQFSIGDVVRLAGVAGRVEDVRLRVTVLRDLEGNVHYIPNGLIEVASNLTQQFATVVADISVAYHEDVDRVIALLGEVLEEMRRDPEWTETFLGDAQVLGVDQLAESAVIVRTTFQVVPDDRWQGRREYLRRVKNRFDAEGIEIPLPYRTVVPGDPSAWQEALGNPPAG